jgi:hypothetical protein
MRRFVFLFVCVLVVSGCHNSADKKAQPATQSINYSSVKIPAFDADSAYSFVAAQVACGYRTPGSRGQRVCADYLVRQMRRWCDTVVVQDFPAVLWDGTEVRGKNIIATVYAREGSPEGGRVLLGAHWDSRMWADHDPDEANHRKPIDGANDGASGVGVLMELARAISSDRLSVPIDFVFFDVEDQGVPEWAEVYADDSWCKGSQYWSNHPHVPFYNATFGILLDMVGTEAPRYTKEQFSRNYASGILDKVWRVADACGYGRMFENSSTDPILDDHYYVNKLAQIPMIDIVQNTPGSNFFKYWHTTGDSMEHVEKNSLRAVGTVLLKTLYGDYGQKR